MFVLESEIKQIAMFLCLKKIEDNLRYYKMKVSLEKHLWVKKLFLLARFEVTVVEVVLKQIREAFRQFLLKQKV